MEIGRKKMIFLSKFIAPCIYGYTKQNDTAKVVHVENGKMLFFLLYPVVVESFVFFFLAKWSIKNYYDYFYVQLQSPPNC